MTVDQLITHLLTFPPHLEVEIKTYSCGTESWTTLDDTMVIDTYNDDGDRIVEITADWN